MSEPPNTPPSLRGAYRANINNCSNYRMPRSELCSPFSCSLLKVCEQFAVHDFLEVWALRGRWFCSILPLYEGFAWFTSILAPQRTPRTLRPVAAECKTLNQILSVEAGISPVPLQMKHNQKNCLEKAIAAVCKKCFPVIHQLPRDQEQPPRGSINLFSRNLVTFT